MDCYTTFVMNPIKYIHVCLTCVDFIMHIHKCVLEPTSVEHAVNEIILGLKNAEDTNSTRYLLVLQYPDSKQLCSKTDIHLMFTTSAGYWFDVDPGSSVICSCSI